MNKILNGYTNFSAIDGSRSSIQCLKANIDSTKTDAASVLQAVHDLVASHYVTELDPVATVTYTSGAVNSYSASCKFNYTRSAGLNFDGLVTANCSLKNCVVQVTVTSADLKSALLRDAVAISKIDLAADVLFEADDLATYKTLTTDENINLMAKISSKAIAMSYLLYELSFNSLDIIDVISQLPENFKVKSMVNVGQAYANYLKAADAATYKTYVDGHSLLDLYIKGDSEIGMYCEIPVWQSRMACYVTEGPQAIDEIDGLMSEMQMATAFMPYYLCDKETLQDAAEYYTKVVDVAIKVIQNTEDAGAREARLIKIYNDAAIDTNDVYQPGPQNHGFVKVSGVSNSNNDFAGSNSNAGIVSGVVSGLASTLIAKFLFK